MTTAASCFDAPPRRGTRKRTTSLRLLVLLLAGILGVTAVPGGAAAADSGSRSGGSVLWRGTFDESDWRRAFGLVPSGQARHASPTNPPFKSDGDVMRVKIDGSSNQRNRRGLEFRSPFRHLGISGQDEVWFRYDVYIPKDFDFVEGGKLPGLSGVTPGSSIWRSASSDNGDHDEGQWSGRVMWRGDGSLTSYLNVVSANGIDHDDNRSRGRIYSISPRWGRKLQRGEWNTVELYYRMNTPGKDNGVHRGWLNGKLGVDLDDVEYRASGRGELDANQINFAVFFGGAKGPRTDQVLYFDNLVISG